MCASPSGARSCPTDSVAASEVHVHWSDTEKLDSLSTGRRGSRVFTSMSTFRSSVSSSVLTATSAAAATVRRPRRCRPWRVVRIVSVLAAHALFLHWFWRALLARDSVPKLHGKRETYGMAVSVCSTLILLLWLIFESLRPTEARGMWYASVFLLGMWLEILVTRGVMLLLVNFECPGYSECFSYAVWSAFQILLDMTAREAIRFRIKVVENAFQENLHSKWILWLALASNAYSIGLLVVLIGAALPIALSPSCVLFPIQIARSWNHPWTGWLMVIPLATWAGTTCITWRAFGRVLDAAKLPEQPSAYVQAEYDWACRVVRHNRCASVIMPLSSAFICSTVLLNLFFRVKFFSSEEVGLADLTLWGVADCLTLLWLVGFFRPTRPNVSPTEDDATVFTKNYAERSNTLEWDSKVSELAHRWMSVEALLDFFCLLGTADAMPHYDPRRHTTNDVVRGAIIPLSRRGSGGVAYASLPQVTHLPPECAESLMPHRMVTHDWRNLFSHLVAAVVADALGEPEYYAIAEALAKGKLEPLRRRLKRAGRHSLRYWLCAFCVNQHGTICNDFGMRPLDPLERERWEENRRDSVTLAPHPCCDCCQPKVLNDAGDACEVNKFDDLMSYLALQVDGFRQVVAVDRKFGILTRLWCIAEMVQAHASGIPQDVRLLSGASLRLDSDDLEVYASLANLRVSECNASRPEDKAWILAKIPDPHDFDARLHAIIFGDHGLLRGTLVGLDIGYAAIRTILRVQAAAHHKDHKDYKDQRDSKDCDLIHAVMP